MAKTAVKKNVNKKLRRTVRKTIAAMLMMSAVIVAAIPVPDIEAGGSYAYNVTPQDEVGIVNTPEGIDLSGTGPQKQSQFVDKLSNGAFELSWQFKYTMQTVGDVEKAIITKYNSTYARDNVTLEVYIPVQYVTVTTAEYTLFYNTNKNDEKEVVQPDTGDDEFLKKYFSREYDSHKKAWEEWKKKEDKDPGNAGPEPVLKRIVDDLSPDQKLEYYCDESTDAGTGGMTISLKGCKLMEVKDSTSGISVPAYMPKSPTVSEKTDKNGFLVKETVSVIGIGDNAFIGITNAFSMTLPSELKYIGKSAFQGSNITSISLTNVMYVGNYAFKECTALDTLGFTEVTAYIGAEAFRSTRISSLPFKRTIEIIGPGAFSNCQNLSSVDFSAITKANAVIGKFAFYDCPNLNTVNFGNSPFIEMGDGAFACSLGVTGGLENFTYPKKLTKIGDFTLGGRTNLKNVVFPADYGATANAVIPPNTFSNCINLATVTFPDSPPGSSGYTSYDPDVLFGDVINKDFFVRGPALNNAGTKATPRTTTWTAKTKITDMRVPYCFTENGIEYYEVSDGNYLLLINAKGELESATLVNESSRDIDFVIPSKVGPFTVNTIKNGAIDEKLKNEIVTVTVEDDSLTKIDDEVFKDAPKLRRVTIGNSVQAIGARAFQNCKNLIRVDFHTPSAGHGSFTIGDSAFETKSKELTFSGDIVVGYAPFEWATDENNFIDKATGKRVCYRSLAPSNFMVMHDNETGLVTMVDYPHYDNIDIDNAEYCAKMHQYYKDNYPEYNKNKYSIKGKYEYIYGDGGTVSGNTPIQPWEMMNNEETDIVNATMQVNIPAGVESIDARKFLESPKNAANVDYLTGSVPGNKSKLLAYSGKSRAGTDPEMVVRPGLFSGDIDEFGAMDTREVVNKGNDRIVAVSMQTVKYLPDYAFDSCENLKEVTIGDGLEDIGTAPFTGCTNLEVVGNNERFTTENGIVYSKHEDGSLNIVECLTARGSLIKPQAINSDKDNPSDPLISQVSSISDGAFKDCENLTKVDLSTAKNLKLIPKEAFNSCEKLNDVKLPEAVKEILDDAFTDNMSALSVTIPGKEVHITFGAFTHNQGTIWTYRDSAAWTYGDRYDIEVLPLGDMFRVTFLDGNMDEIETQRVERGKDATPPEPPTVPGFTFVEWKGNYKNIQADTTVVAKYQSDGSDGGGEGPDQDGKFAVTYVDGSNGKQIGEIQKVESGKDATPPTPPTHTGLKFKEWSAASTNITKNMIITALYSSSGGGSGGGNNGGGNNGGGNNNGGGGNNDGSSSNSDTKSYFVTVTGGGGGGYYSKGAIVTIWGNPAAAGKTFDKWTSTSNGVGFANVNSNITKFTMPGNDVTVVANYKDGSASGNNTVTPETPVKKPGTGGGGSGSGIKDNTVKDPVKGDNTTGDSKGTVVSITKPGFSNTDKASAIVNGSADNFVIKIIEDAEAQAAIEAALLADQETLDNIKYFAMDISMYDSTGTNRITDTKGISVDITIPLPDELIGYGGNNKVAGVVNGKLDKLSPKFKTIEGVACVTFRASHFSPYTIYVDTANLTAGTVDSTPKTGDGIHPKWFLVLGLGCISMVLFVKRDKYAKINIA